MGTASQKSDADIWAHLDEHVWSNPPYDNPNAISPTVNRLQAEHGYFHDTLQSLGDSLQDAYEHRVGIGQKVDTAVAGISKIIEPVILIIIGSTVAVVVAAIMLPIMQLSNLSGVI